MILIGLGANLDSEHGTSVQALLKAVESLSDYGVKVISTSSIWESAPVPISDQPWYKNAVCEVETSLSAHELLNVLFNIEEKAGRTRYKINEARVLDLDLLSYDNQVIEEKDLHVPHPRMHMRAFVLYPLQEVWSEWIHPVLGGSVGEMIEDIDPEQQIKKMALNIFSEGC